MLISFCKSRSVVSSKTMRMSCSFAVAVAIAVFMVVARVAVGEVVNETNSRAGLYLSNSRDVGDDIGLKTKATESPSIWNDGEPEGMDGGFSSLDGMLQWAIGHSDPSKLKEGAEDTQRSSPEELQKRRDEIKELMEKLRVPSDAEIMKRAIDDLNNMSLSTEDHCQALEELSILVEPIDNANDLHKLGGTLVLINELKHSDSQVRTISALVLGKACQNNPVVQNQFLELGALSELMRMTKSESSEEVIKALFAISALIRNNPAGQKTFYAEAGDSMIQNMLSKSNIDIRIRRKTVSIVTDLADSQLENPSYPEPSFFSNSLFLRSLVDLLASTDLDLQEKVLYAVQTVLKLQSTDVSVFKKVGGLDSALDKMREQLQGLAGDELHGEHAADVESLRREVEEALNGKISKPSGTPGLVLAL